MYNQDKQQFIFKLSNSDTWNFFVDEKNNLCYSCLTPKKEWSKPTIIKKQVYHSFYSDIDKKDNFHILFQDLNGNIFYTFISSKISKTIQLLKAKISSCYNKYLHLIPLSDSIHFFYVLHYKNSSILSHQILKNATLSSPQILASSTRTLYPYSVFSTSLENIYLYYNFFDGEFFQLGYKIYSPFESLWTKFSKITASNSNIYLGDAFIDSNNISHILYQEKTNNNTYKLHYLSIPDNGFKKEVLHEQQNIFCNLNLIYNKDLLIAFWVTDNNIFFTKSQHSTNEWSKISEYLPDKETFSVKFKSNFSKDSNFFVSNSIPTNFHNGYTLASFGDISLNYINVNSISTNDFKTIVLDSLNLLKNKFETLDYSILQLKSLYKTLNDGYINLKKDVDLIKQKGISSKRTSASPKLIDAEAEYKKFYKELIKTYHINDTNSYNTRHFSSNCKTNISKKKKLHLNTTLKNKTLKKS